MADESNAGPFRVGLSEPLAPGETRVIELSEVETGPSNKKGYLRKIFGTVGGMDYIYVVNASSELISVEAGTSDTVVPDATSQNLDSGPYRRVKIGNEGATEVNTSDSDQIAIQVGNGPRNVGEDEQSNVNAIIDAIPGGIL